MSGALGFSWGVWGARFAGFVCPAPLSFFFYCKKKIVPFLITSYRRCVFVYDDISVGFDALGIVGCEPRLAGTLK